MTSEKRLTSMAMIAVNSVLKNAHTFAVEQFKTHEDEDPAASVAGYINEVIEEVINEFGTFDEEAMDYFLTDFPEQDQVTAIAWEIL